MELCCSSSSATLMVATRLLPTNPFLLSSSNTVFFRNDLREKTQKLVLCRVGVPPSSRRRFEGCRCLFGLGVPELVVIAGVAALVFGPKKLPEIGRSIGKTVKSFQEAAKEFETELKKEPEGSESTTSDEKPKAVDNENEEKNLRLLEQKKTPEVV